MNQTPAGPCILIILPETVGWSIFQAQPNSPNFPAANRPTLTCDFNPRASESF